MRPGRKQPAPTLPVTNTTRPADLVSPVPGCHDCPAWSRVGSAIGRCGSATGPHRGSLISYVVFCSGHPAFPKTPDTAQADLAFPQPQENQHGETHRRSL